MQSMAAHKRGVDSPTPRLGINQTISTYWPLLSCVREQGGVSERPGIERAGQLSALSSKFEGERERAKFQFPVFPTSTFNGWPPTGRCVRTG